MTNKTNPRLIISAPHSGTGKTTLTIALMATLCKRGLKVQPYKVGPDYIDPGFHETVTGRPSINIDGWLLEESRNIYLFNKYSKEADINIIEGVMGLYDGYGKEPMLGSTAHISKILKAPVILVMNAKGMSTSAAAIVHGMKTFRDVSLEGVIINIPMSGRHYEILKETIEKNTNVPVIGYLPKLDDVKLESRHLGLIQSSEIEDITAKVNKLAETITSTIDIDKLIEIANNTEMLEDTNILKSNKIYGVHIAVAKDKAFSFHYNENIEMLKGLGAEIHYFSPLQDKLLPEKCDGIYLAGGYPEVFAKELSNNMSLMQDIKEKADENIPIYAECGGYMYLHETITNLESETYRMVGIFKGGAYMKKRLQNFGYVSIKTKGRTPLFDEDTVFRAHEFHRSVVDRTEEEPTYVIGEKGNKIWYCGKLYKNAYGMYPHIYFPAEPSIPEKFLYTASIIKRQKEINNA
ncbi:cobyrinate a,c-diamide synthase [Vallitalea longa]|uniref:Cobyrinate a,c-diamide synthase n=1 Tax=Vallitalea longa TaxID=2936439 RepID=A0A9W5YD52_9FIRM|nr:cobyrinate a,c-diamide synthase [Vallitalea longa]GKX31287.1 cobyrinate a,c-diamide synthase [Vallitalea longa]